jgi:hypothetical protein
VIFFYQVSKLSGGSFLGYSCIAQLNYLFRLFKLLFLLPAVMRIRAVLCRIRPFSHPESGSKHFFIPDPVSYMKSGMQTYFFSCFICFQEQSLSLIHSQKDPGSGKNSSRIQGVKKHRIQRVKKHRIHNTG